MAEIKVQLNKRYYDKCGHYYLVVSVDESAKPGYEVTALCERTGADEHFNLNGRYSLACKSIYDLIGEVKNNG